VPTFREELATDAKLTASRARYIAASLGLLFVLLIGLALRLFYLLRASPFVDEYSTLMAVQGILAHGIPVLPSGFFYGSDLLYSYVAAAAAMLWSGHLVAVRLLSLLASLGAVILTFWAGRGLFSARAGLLSAGFLALSPEAVLWGARGRAYALEQLVALGAFWLFYKGVVREGPLWRRLGLLALVAAVFIHPEAALMLPALALAVSILQGLRWWLHLDRLIEFALAAAGVVARYWLHGIVAGGDVGGFDAIANARPAFGVLANWGSGLETVAEFLLATPVVIATVLALLAIFTLGLRARKDPRAYAVRFLAITLVTILVQTILIIGSTWQSTRYLLFAAPLLFLLAGAGLEGVAVWLTPRVPRAADKIAAGFTVVVLLLFLPAAVRAANTSEIAYDLAFDYVGERWIANDRLATLAPAAAWIGLGHVDYFALGNTFEEFVWQRDGQWYDKWVGAPLIHTALELDTALDEAEAAGATLWLVTDEPRLLQRYDSDFAQTVWDRMSLVYAEGRAQVFRSQSARPYAVEVSTPRPETFANQIALAGYAIGGPAQSGMPPEGALVVEPGQRVPLQLTWQALSPLSDTYTVFVHLVAPDGSGLGQVDGLPLGGLYPMHLWEPGIRYPDRWELTLPENLVPGRYRLEVGLYELESGDRLPVTEGPGRLPGDALILDYLTVPAGMAPTAPEELLDAELGGAVRLLGITPDLANQVVRPAGKLPLTLHWQVIRPTEQNYTLFVHVVAEDGRVLTQHDGPPQGGFYPTAFWDPGEQLEDQVTLTIPSDASPGTYRVIAGFYLLDTGERLPVTGADAIPGDAVLMGTLDVEP
jgi:4-amino-4-deoxy-L-arabinose transferase-like glycosyltransferase